MSDILPVQASNVSNGTDLQRLVQMIRGGSSFGSLRKTERPVATGSSEKRAVEGKVAEVYDDTSVGLLGFNAACWGSVRGFDSPNVMPPPQTE